MAVRNITFLRVYKIYYCGIINDFSIEQMR